MHEMLFSKTDFGWTRPTFDTTINIQKVIPTVIGQSLRAKVYTGRPVAPQTGYRLADFESTYITISPPKIENFQIKKNSDIFHIFAQNIDRVYSLEPPRF